MDLHPTHGTLFTTCAGRDYSPDREPALAKGTQTYALCAISRGPRAVLLIDHPLTLGRGIATLTPGRNSGWLRLSGLGGTSVGRCAGGNLGLTSPAPAPGPPYTEVTHGNYTRLLRAPEVSASHPYRITRPLCPPRTLSGTCGGEVPQLSPARSSAGNRAPQD